jgi:hypothetical protein
MILGTAKKLFTITFSPALEPNCGDLGLFLWKYRNWSMKQTTYLHLVPRLRLHETILPLPHIVYITGTSVDDLSVTTKKVII